MNERPIIFSGSMVRAILDGRKTQTRRVIKPQPPYGGPIHGPEMYEPVAYDRHGEMIPGHEIYGVFDDSGEWGVKCPYGQPGDRLWVRETFTLIDEMHGDNTVFYRADEEPDEADAPGPWKPSIHMPRKCCRLLLDVTAVRVERLQEIGEADAKAEGVNSGKVCDSNPFRRDISRLGPLRDGTYRGSFIALWNSLNEKRGFGWDTNPWVWVISFDRAATGG